RQLAVALDGAHDLEPVRRRDEQIEQDQVGAVGLDPSESFLSVLGAGDLVPSHGQPLGDQIDAVPVVVADQDAKLPRRDPRRSRRCRLDLSLHETPPVSRGSLLSRIDCGYSIPPKKTARNVKNPDLTPDCGPGPTDDRQVFNAVATEQA